MAQNHLLDCISQYDMIPQKSTVFLGVSGGADSIYLLHRLYLLQDTLDFSLVALHFNHQLRGLESDGDEQFVRDFIVKFCPSVPLIVDTAPVATLAQSQKLGIEEMARRCRYDFFHKYTKNVECSRIATAHTADDNGETVVMNLVRGAGLNGLSGIPPLRDNIIRPLLTTTRQEIEGYLRLHALPHREDSSNADLSYTRNRLRHQVMPILRDQNPNFLESIAQITSIYRQEHQILEDLATQSLPSVIVHGDGLSLSTRELIALPLPLALRGIEQLAQKICPQLVLERGHRLNILALCGEEISPSASLNLPQGLIVRREYDKLVFTTKIPEIFGELRMQFPCEMQIGGYEISAQSGIYVGANSPWDFWFAQQFDRPMLRPRQTGDRLARANRPEKTVKSLMIDEKIPKHCRDSLPVFTAEDRILAVAGLGVSQFPLPNVGGIGWHVIIQKIKN